MVAVKPARNPVGVSGLRTSCSSGCLHELRSMTPVLAATLLIPPRELESPDRAGDAAAIRAATFARLRAFLWEARPTEEDVEHPVSFPLAAVHR
jgi:hypothetical protein